MHARDCDGRRRLLRAGLAAGVSSLLPPHVLAAAGEQAQDNPAALRPKPGDLLVKADDAEHRPLRPEDVPLNARQISAWAMDPADKIVRSGSRFNALVVLRLEETALTAATRARAAEGVL